MCDENVACALRHQRVAGGALGGVAVARLGLDPRADVAGGLVARPDGEAHLLQVVDRDVGEGVEVDLVLGEGRAIGREAACA